MQREEAEKNYKNTVDGAETSSLPNAPYNVINIIGNLLETNVVYVDGDNYVEPTLMTSGTPGLYSVVLSQ